jgi:lysylphosphatidylglycerol synthetase-like protein (DUF2156 family)
MIDFALYLSYFLIIVSALAALAFPLKYLLQHISEAKGTFIGIGVMALILVLGYVFASSDYTFNGIENYGATKNTVKLVGAGLNSFFILFGISVVSTIYFEVKKFLK